MKITVVCQDMDHTFSLDVQRELTLENFRALCSVELRIETQLILIIFNGKCLDDYKQTLGSCGIGDNDIILVERGIAAAMSREMQQGGSHKISGIPTIDFSSIKIPGQSSSRATTSSHSRSVPIDQSDPEVIRQKFLSNKSDLAILRERNPALAEAIVKGGDAFAKQLEDMREAKAQMEREKICMLNADPLDPAVQNKIAEEIRQQNIQENMNMAIEEAPESFGQVVMLWIDVKVNGHHVKAFVDSGAQMTIMSASCAEKCHIGRLVDLRWEGIAKGVGVQKIIGRIHLAQMQIENDFLACSFSVLEDQPMDVLLGLDMLRRHQCVIDLKNNVLRIGTTGTETPFLQESEIPQHGRNHDPANSLQSNREETEEEKIAKAIQVSSEEALSRKQQENPDSKQLGFLTSCDFSGASRPLEDPEPKPVDNQTSSSQASSISRNQDFIMVLEEGLKQLMDMGFERTIAEKALRQCDGDVQQATVALLSRSEGS